MTTTTHFTVYPEGVLPWTSCSWTALQNKLWHEWEAVIQFEVYIWVFSRYAFLTAHISSGLMSFIENTNFYFMLCTSADQCEICLIRFVYLLLIRIANESFEKVTKFKYLGMTLTSQNDIHDEIKSRLNSGNACYYSVQNLLSSCLISKNLKIKIYKTVILPVVLYGCKI
jgi:hypothetical protein